MLLFFKKISTLNFKFSFLLLLSGMLFITYFSSSFAEEAYELEKITVTAQKREENVQMVTPAITVLSDVFIEDVGIESTRDIF